MKKAVEDENERSDPEGFDAAYQRVVRTNIIDLGKRPDGRKTDEIRDIWCEVSVSPRAHGSGLFTRGETQVLTLATLGTPKEAQELDNLSPEGSKHYMHHYNFPPFSTGEVKRPGRSRREIGTVHWLNASCACVQTKKFPTPCAVSRLSSMLTSMASVCGSTWPNDTVCDQGPCRRIAMGLTRKGNNTRFLPISRLKTTLGDMTSRWLVQKMHYALMDIRSRIYSRDHG